MNFSYCFFLFSIKCVDPKCKAGYGSIDHQSKKIETFHFIIKKHNLSKQWIHFPSQIDQEPTQYSILCELHFEDHFINSTKRCNLKWQLNPATTLFSRITLILFFLINSCYKKVTYSEYISSKWRAKFPWPRYNVYI